MTGRHKESGLNVRYRCTVHWHLTTEECDHDWRRSRRGGGGECGASHQISFSVPDALHHSDMFTHHISYQLRPASQCVTVSGAVKCFTERSEGTRGGEARYSHSEETVSPARHDAHTLIFPSLSIPPLNHI